MTRRIVLLSGPIAAGKTTLAAALATRFAITGFKTKRVVDAAEREATSRPELGASADRAILQRAGDALDHATGGRWVSDALLPLVTSAPHGAWTVDAVRTEQQVAAVRSTGAASVVHIHLTAPLHVLEDRYASRAGTDGEFGTYAASRANDTESRVEHLATLADLVIDTGRSSPEDVLTRVAAFLGLYGRGYDRLVDVMVGGQYGSEGKGHIAAHVANEYSVLMRVGGPNAGHKVYEEPTPFTFHQLPSGTRRNPRARILIGAGAVISAAVLQREIDACSLTPDRLAVDEHAMVIDPQDVEAERRLAAEIGSTGQGVGAATSRKVLRTNAAPPVQLAKDLPSLRPFVRPTRPLLDEAFRAGERVFLEGTQGTALSLHHGAYPYVTSRDTTVSGCLAEAGIAPARVRRVVMVCRTYPIRVASPRDATSGPMARELTLQDIAVRSGLELEELERTERTSTTNRERRIAEFDWALLRASASLNAPTDLALSFTDYLSVRNRDARRFEQLTEETRQFITDVEQVAAAPVSLIVTRFHARSIIDRRAW